MAKDEPPSGIFHPTGWKKFGRYVLVKVTKPDGQHYLARLTNVEDGIAKLNIINPKDADRQDVIDVIYLPWPPQDGTQVQVLTGGR